ncbi:DUF2490 domain-containing protein [Chryseobacterium indologenes]|nr:DUF2490 domain-containing protein [Chryseobacterium indologenes]ATN04140.1 DUF2490 domain-containing protein [Chryseobacterium indologenes]AYY83195.1 DUF2490 domain-containing protein [Chryseobacterium indologenes]VFA43751.1 Protein of uncharacterised function (DUF2490) [Chryseobacterium indologenes]HAO26976.1 DUF2490 domain-containing protein [Chryseobacterium indologenes]
MNKASNFVSTNHSRCFTPEFVSEFSASQLLLLLFKKLLMTLSIRKFFVGLFLLSFMTGIVQAQISPPGLGDASTAFWSAFGVKRQLDSLGKKSTMSYIAIGRKSSPDNDNLFSKQAIFVVNHEFYHSFAPHQQYSYAISYRRQPQYESEAPYEKESTEQEFRIYGRYAYTFDLGKRFKLKNTVRQEFRKFFDAGFHQVEEDFQLRTRIKSQLTYNLSPKNNQKLALGAEALFSISHMNEPDAQWNSFGYREMRLTAYYMFSIPHSPFTVDIGYMDDLIRGSESIHHGGVHYVAADLIWNIPYKKR